jgi:hypothetical protein
LTAATARGSAGTTYPSLAISHHRITSHLLRPCQGSLTNFYNSTTPPTHPPTHQKECFCIYFTLFIYYIEGKKKAWAVWFGWGWTQGRGEWRLSWYRKRWDDGVINQEDQGCETGSGFFNLHMRKWFRRASMLVWHVIDGWLLPSGNIKEKS